MRCPSRAVPDDVILRSVRAHGISRGAATYHAYELQQIYDPSIKQVIEIRYEQRKQQDDSGEPPFRITIL